MKIYIAHNYIARHDLKTLTVPLIEKAGHTVTSRWIKEPDSTEALSAKSARMDLDDLDAADVLLFYASQFGPTPGRGKFFELGYAFALAKKCYLMRDKELACVFYHLPEIEHVLTIGEFLGRL